MEAKLTELREKDNNGPGSVSSAAAVCCLGNVSCRISCYTFIDTKNLGCPRLLSEDWFDSADLNILLDSSFSRLFCDYSLDHLSRMAL